MQCPLFVDYARECQYKIGFLPIDTGSYCSTEKHQQCPFYIAINDLGYACKYLNQCPAFEHFKSVDFDEFLALVNKYCLSEKNNSYCKRFKIRKRGNIPPFDLMPDGSIFK
ncbi:MAG: hypothetical protein KKD05_10825 [Candidatus Omnitrophica bacterium]|nr:hypothetical protein [Candidatus Omnitrophota bacterium]